MDAPPPAAAMRFMSAGSAFDFPGFLYQAGDPRSDESDEQQRNRPCERPVSRALYAAL